MVEQQPHCDPLRLCLGLADLFFFCVSVDRFSRLLVETHGLLGGDWFATGANRSIISPQLTYFLFFFLNFDHYFFFKVHKVPLATRHSVLRDGVEGGGETLVSFPSSRACAGGGVIDLQVDDLTRKTFCLLYSLPVSVLSDEGSLGRGFT